MEYPTLEAAWADFKTKVVRGRATPTQERDMRIVFMAGAGAMFGMMNQASALPEDTAMGYMARLEAEIAVFYLSQTKVD